MRRLGILTTVALAGLVTAGLLAGAWQSPPAQAQSGQERLVVFETLGRST